jgi:hypothetical protein
MKIFRFVVLAIIVFGLIGSLPVYGVDVVEYNRAIEAYRDYLNTDFNLEIKEFAIIDMDGDRLPEVILSDNAGCRLVLHYDNDIHADSFEFHGMITLKKDGTFFWLVGAGSWGYSKLQFINGTYEKKYLCRHRFDFDSDNELCSVYYLNDEEVSQKDYDLFVAEYEQKEDADWYEFNETNINKYLITIPAVAPKTGDIYVIFAVVNFAVAAAVCVVYKKIVPRKRHCER